MKNQKIGKGSTLDSQKITADLRVSHSNYNSPKNKIVPDKAAIDKIGTLNTKREKIKSQLNTKAIPSDQGHIGKTMSSIVSPGNKQILPQQKIQSKQIHKDYLRKDNRLSSPKNTFQPLKQPNKKNPQQNLEANIPCTFCTQLESKHSNHLDDIKSKYEGFLQQKNNQIAKLEIESKGMKQKMAIYQEIVKKHKKLVREQVQEFHDNGKQKLEYQNKIRQLQETIKRLEKQNEEKQISKQKQLVKEGMNGFANLVEVESEFISNFPIGMSSVRSYTNLKEQSLIKDQNEMNYNQSMVYRMVCSENTQNLSKNQGNSELYEKIRKQFDQCLEAIQQKLTKKNKDLQIQIVKKNEMHNKLKQEFQLQQKEKNQMKEKLQTSLQSIELLKKQKLSLQQQLEYQKTKSQDYTSTTINEQIQNQQQKINRRRKINNKNCLKKLDKIKSLSQQQIQIVENMKYSTKMIFSHLKQEESSLKE